MLKIFDYTITKTKEYQTIDCAGNKFCAGTNEDKIKTSIERYMLVNDFFNKEKTSVDFLYDVVAAYHGVTEPLRKTILQTPYEGLDCALHAWCLLLLRDEFRIVAESVGILFAETGYITLSAIRKRIKRHGYHMQLARIRFVQAVMQGLEVVETHGCEFFIRQNLIRPNDSTKFGLIDATINGLKLSCNCGENDADGQKMMTLSFFPFLDKTKLRILSEVLEEDLNEQ